MENSVKDSVRVSYLLGSHKDGTIYTQQIKVNLTQVELDAFNIYVTDKVLNKETDANTKLFLKSVKDGRNYTNLTTFKEFVSFFHLEDNKRIKYDRNTILKVFVYAF